MANLDIPYNPEITQERVEADLRAAFGEGSSYRVFTRGKYTWVSTESGWKGVAVRVQQKEGERTRFRLNRHIPEIKYRLLLLPLVLLAVLGLIAAILAIQASAKPIEDAVRLHLEQKYGTGAQDKGSSAAPDPAPTA